jgi:hypothetical protein
MTAICVETSRIVDRDALRDVLAEQGLDADTKERDGTYALELECDEQRCRELVRAIEEWMAENEIPLVPQLVDDRLILRPPLA